MEDNNRVYGIQESNSWITGIELMEHKTEARGIQD